MITEQDAWKIVRDFNENADEEFVSRLVIVLDKYVDYSKQDEKINEKKANIKENQKNGI